MDLFQVPVFDTEDLGLKWKLIQCEMGLESNLLDLSKGEPMADVCRILGKEMERVVYSIDC